MRNKQFRFTLPADPFCIDRVAKMGDENLTQKDNDILISLLKKLIMRRDINRKLLKHKELI